MPELPMQRIRRSALSRLLMSLAICCLSAATTPAQEPAAEKPEASQPEKLSNTLRWTTASEVDNFGFDVYRADQEAGPFARLTQEPIPGAGTTDVPTNYAYVDDTIEPDREYFYYVESIAMDGRREHFTPVVRVGPKRRPQ